jgi:hypothetical protein
MRVVFADNPGLTSNLPGSGGIEESSIGAA